MSKNARSPSVKRSGEQNSSMKPKRGLDRRIRRTHERLGRSVIALIQEKPMHRVTVREVLERAQVGRSTFYLHFRDKDDLFTAQMEQGLEQWSTALSRTHERSDRVAPIAEMFGHIGQQKKLYQALVESKRIDVFFELAQGYFARGIEQRLKESARARGVTQAELAARSFA